MLHIRLKLCSRFCIKIHLCQKPCHQREKISSAVAFEEIQQSVPRPWRYLSILSCADQVILMCRQAQKQHLQWTSRWVSNSCSLINGAKSISLYPKGVHIISFHANCLGCFYRIIHRIWEIAPQKMTCCKPPQACGWGTINCQEVGCILTTCKIFYLFNFSCYFHWLIIFFFCDLTPTARPVNKAKCTRSAGLQLLSTHLVQHSRPALTYLQHS